ncbi:uncharacterized protein [Paramormyrops kingsleyae]|uniref:uncharacterized protein isoform X2 n=1 Tax=Paramormyrops kingsleyae TaxID=1676925 RepID=UPI000CD5CF6D|nr:uncharacterized protein LOC111844737 isoform X2 [Paramormyrops kingsleyae]
MEHNKGEKCSLPQLLLHCLEECTEVELKHFKWHLVQLKLDDFAPISRSRLEKMDMLDLVDRMLMTYCPEGAVKVVLHVLRNMQQNELVRRLERDSSLLLCQRCPDQSMESGDCSSDSEDSVYLDAEEGNSVSEVARGQGVSEEREEQGPVTATSLSEEQKEDICTKHEEGGCAASQTSISELREQGAPAEKEAERLLIVTSECGKQEEDLLQQEEAERPTLITNHSAVQKEGLSTENEAECLIPVTRECGKPEEGGATSASHSASCGASSEGLGGAGPGQHDPSEAGGVVILQNESAHSSGKPRTALELLAVDLTFKMVNQTLQKLVYKELERFKKRMFRNYPELFEQQQDQNVQDFVKTLMQGTNKHEALNIILQNLRAIDQEELANSLEKEAALQKFQDELLFKLKREFRRIF